jgi:acetylornithine deacetylase
MTGAGEWRSRVLGYIDDHQAQIVASLCDLVRVPSISGSDAENSIQSRLATELEQSGLDVDHWPIDLDETLAGRDFPGVEVDRREAWGVVGRLSGRAGGPSLMLNSHVDVVPPGDPDSWKPGPAFTGHADNASIYGRGACDMKGGLVAAHWAARAIAALSVPLQGDLLVACVQGEEDGGLGTYATLRRGWRADACVIPEPTSLDISPANGGSLTFRLVIPGRATHASRRTSGVSAIEKFFPVFQAIRRLEAERNVETDPLMSPWDIAYPIEIGMVQSGDWASTVPDRLTAEGRYGVALGERVEDARTVFATAIADACAQDPWLRDHPVEVEWWGGQFAPGLTPADSDIIATVRRAHESVSSYPQQMWGSPYGSDLRLMTDLGGIPTVHYGPGNARLAHAPNECVDIAEVMTATAALAVAALEHCLVG